MAKSKKQIKITEIERAGTPEGKFLFCEEFKSSGYIYAPEYMTDFVIIKKDAVFHFSLPKPNAK